MQNDVDLLLRFANLSDGTFFTENNMQNDVDLLLHFANLSDGTFFTEKLELKLSLTFQQDF
jgi:hypothetical protein